MTNTSPIPSAPRTAAAFSLMAFGLIALEFFYMAAPFAAFFYSSAQPWFGWLGNLPGSRLLAAFFLPHLAEQTRSPLIDLVRPMGLLLALAGLVAFAICAAQVYWAKLRRSGPVRGGLYRRMRHPQYTAFIVSSLGLLLLWPRIVTLVLFVTMVFAYRLLALAEERECSAKFGSAYRDHVAQLPRFLPFTIPGIPPRPAVCHDVALPLARTVLVWGATLLIAVALAFATRRAAVASLYTAKFPNGVAYSLLAHPSDQLLGMVDLANSAPQVHNALEQCQSEKLIAYVVPEGLFVSEIPMAPRQGAASHVDAHPSDTGRYTVVFAITEGVPSEAEGTAILTSAHSSRGLIEADIDWQRHEVTSIRSAPAQNRYGTAAMPLF